jgi:hypothetical protein
LAGGSLPSDVAIFTVRMSSTSSIPIEASSMSRRRQYTDGACGPTGWNMLLPR